MLSEIALGREDLVSLVLLESGSLVEGLGEFFAETSSYTGR